MKVVTVYRENTRCYRQNLYCPVDDSSPCPGFAPPSGLSSITYLLQVGTKHIHCLLEHLQDTKGVIITQSTVKQGRENENGKYNMI